MSRHRTIDPRADPRRYASMPHAAPWIGSRCTKGPCSSVATASSRRCSKRSMRPDPDEVGSSCSVGSPASGRVASRTSWRPGPEGAGTRCCGVAVGMAPGHPPTGPGCRCCEPTCAPPTATSSDDSWGQVRGISPRCSRSCARQLPGPPGSGRCGVGVGALPAVRLDRHLPAQCGRRPPAARHPRRPPCGRHALDPAAPLRGEPDGGHADAPGRDLPRCRADPRSSADRRPG